MDDLAFLAVVWTFVEIGETKVRGLSDYRVVPAPKIENCARF
jgi:hypothetical protein